MPPPPPKLRALRRHQQRAYAFAKLPPSQRNGLPAYVAALFMRPGTGKTLTAIRLAKHILTERNNPQKGPDYQDVRGPILLCCRREDFLTWTLELDREGIPDVAILKIDNTTSAVNKDLLHPHSREQTQEGYHWEISNFDFVFVTWDLLRNERLRKMIRQVPWSLKIGDELHLIKRSQAKRTKAALTATAHVPRALGLTGTPITNDPRDLFTQCSWIAGSRSPLGQNEWAFLHKFYVQAPRDPSIQSYGQWYLKRGAKTAISLALKPLAFYVHEDEALPDLPPRVDVVKSLPLTGMQRRHYLNLLTNWDTTFLAASLPETQEVELVVAQLQKLRQITSGFMYVDRYDTPEEGHVHPDDPRYGQLTKTRDTVQLRSAKHQLLLDLFDPKKDGPYADKERYPGVVIWDVYTASIERTYNTLRNRAQVDGERVLQYTGALSPRARENVRKSFASNPRIRFFIGNVDMGVGMNELVKANLVIYLNNSDKVVSRDQSELRTRRIGSEHHKNITYVDLVAEQTFEEKQTRRRCSAIALARDILTRLKSGQSVKEAFDA